MTEERTYQYHSDEEYELAGVLGLCPDRITFRLRFHRGGYLLSFRFPGSLRFKPYPAFRGRRAIGPATVIWATLEKGRQIGERLS